MTEVALTWDKTVGDFSKWTRKFTRPDLAPGSAQWGVCDLGITKLMYICPCGCGDWRSIHVTETSDASKGWRWDGNREAPTLSPSIKHNPGRPGSDDCNWHGHLIAGVWRGQRED